MKEKIFNKLKQAYSSLGLGDEILQAHAQGLADLGLVTDVNLETVIGAQKSYLEGLQKLNDKRATDAADKARRKAREEFEEETKKKEEEAKKQAEEEAKRKAEEDAKKKAEKEAEKKAKAEEEARKQAEEEAKKKAEEEERKRQEDIKNAEISEQVKKLIEEADARQKKSNEEAELRLKQQSEAYEKLIKGLEEKAKANESAFEKYAKEQSEKTQALLDRYDAMKKEADDAKAESAKRKRQDFIMTTANNLKIPQSRIEEGFVIADDADENTITEYLTKVANNIKAQSLPQSTHQQIDENTQPTKEEVDAIASSLMKHY